MTSPKRIRRTSPVDHSQGLQERVEALREGEFQPVYEVIQQYWDVMPYEEGIPEALMQKIPDPNDPLYPFEKQLITDVLQQWSPLKLLRGPVFPVAGQEWTQHSIPPHFAEHLSSNVHLIEMKRVDPKHPHLNQYAWLVHELLHAVLHYQEPDTESLGDAVHQAVFNLMKKRLTLRDFEHSLEHKTARFLQSYWTPSDVQRDWFHELFIDYVCLWLLGPAYMVSHVDAHEERNLNPYHLSHHPPVLLRTQALRAGARNLGWTKELEELDELIRKYEKQTPQNITALNLYHAVARQDFVSHVHLMASDFCEGQQLLRLNADRLEHLTRAALRGEVLEGLDLIIGVAMRYANTREGEEQALQDWEATLMHVRGLL